MREVECHCIIGHVLDVTISFYSLLEVVNHVFNKVGAQIQFVEHVDHVHI